MAYENDENHEEGLLARSPEGNHEALLSMSGSIVEEVHRLQCSIGL
jgi:hypothetical protein